MPLLSNIELILNPNAASLSKRFLVKELWAQSIKKLLRRPSEPAREIGSYRLWLNELLQLRVLLLSLLQDEDVGVAILADRDGGDAQCRSRKRLRTTDARKRKHVVFWK